MAAGVLIYANTLHVPFVLDDKTTIVENHLIKSLNGFLSSAIDYNPRRLIGYLSFAINFRFGGLDITGYHLFNIAVHLLSALLVYRLCLLTCKTPLLKNSRITDNTPLICLAAALLFVSHPVQTQAVTYISQRFASLATMFYLLSMVLYARARLVSSSGSYLLFLASLVAMVLAMMSKEIAFTLPLMLILYEVSFFPSCGRKRYFILLPLLLTIIILPLALLHSNEPLGNLLSELSNRLNAATGISRTDYLLTQFSVITTYIKLLFLPLNQNLDYSYSLYHSLFTPRVFSSFLFLACLLATAVWFFIKARHWQRPELRLISFGIFWFFIALSVESSIIPISDVIFEHRLYLPSAGAFIAISVALSLAIPRKAFTVVLVISVTALSIATWQRNQVWGDELTLWQDTVKKSPDKDRPHNNLAEAYNKRGRVDEAIKEVQIALKLNPGNAEAHSNLAAAYLAKGETEQALEHLQTAVKLDDNLFTAHYNLGILYRQRSDYDMAIGQLLLALKINPDFAEAHNQLAVAYAGKDMLDKAIEHFREAVRLQPGSPQFRENLDKAVKLTTTD